MVEQILIHDDSQLTKGLLTAIWSFENFVCVKGDREDPEMIAGSISWILNHLEFGYVVHLIFCALSVRYTLPLVMEAEDFVVCNHHLSLSLGFI